MLIIYIIRIFPPSHDCAVICQVPAWDEETTGQCNETCRPAPMETARKPVWVSRKEEKIVDYRRILYFFWCVERDKELSLHTHWGPLPFN